MEHKHDSLKKLKSEDKQHKIKKPLLKKKAKQKNSPKDEKKLEDLKEPEPEDKPVEEENAANSIARASPEPNCAICLEPLANKSFTDNCFHTFCFTCLLEWSKVKAECPLCKKQFKSIVHNVQNDMTFDEYHIQTRSTSNLWSAVYGSDEQRFRYPSTMTTARHYQIQNDNYQSQIASHRMRYAPHSVQTYSNGQITSRVRCGFRRRVYAQNLWVRSSLEKRTRNVSADFYRRNPACTHRLLPWLNRELITLFRTNESQVTFVLELIIALVARYEITSQEFYIHIQPYIGTSTRHFIHEFFHFAISPYDMENYDIFADYGLSAENSNRDETSSPDSDIIVDDSFNPNINPSPVPSRFSEQNKRVKKSILKRTGENSWQCVRPLWHSYLSPGPSTSYNTSVQDFARALTASPILNIEDQDDEDIQVVQVLKPRAERTPEIVDLSSDDDVHDIISQTIINIPSENESLTPLYSPGSTPHFNFSPTNEDYFSSEIECVYESEKPPASQINLQENQDSTPGDQDATIVKNMADTVLLGNASTSTADNETDKNNEESKVKVPTLASAIVRPWASTDSAGSKSEFSLRRKHASSNFDSSTDSYSDYEPITDKSPAKKRLKLRSVVAHFSFDRSSDNRHGSSHSSSSHKKHKDKKKKKKKKHSHKHKRRLYSDSESSQKNDL